MASNIAPRHASSSVSALNSLLGPLSPFIHRREPSTTLSSQATCHRWSFAILRPRSAAKYGTRSAACPACALALTYLTDPIASCNSGAHSRAGMAEIPVRSGDRPTLARQPPSWDCPTRRGEAEDEQTQALGHRATANSMARLPCPAPAVCPVQAAARQCPQVCSKSIRLTLCAQWDASDSRLTGDSELRAGNSLGLPSSLRGAGPHPWHTSISYNALLALAACARCSLLLLP